MRKHKRVWNQFVLILPADVIDRVDKLAKQRDLERSNMIGILLGKHFDEADYKEQCRQTVEWELEEEAKRQNKSRDEVSQIALKYYLQIQKNIRDMEE